MTDFPEQRSVGFFLSFELFQAEASLLKFLLIRLAQHHREQLPVLLTQGHVRVDQNVVMQDRALQSGQLVTLYLPDHWEDAVDSHWRLLWENNELMTVYKAHLLPVSRTTRNLYNTLISLIRRQTPYPEAHLLHRLDSETAGIVLIAKNSAADKRYKPQLEQLLQRKIYHAWVQGVPEWQQLDFSCELGEKTGSVIRSQVYVLDPANQSSILKPRFSRTLFRVLRSEQGRTLIECELKTGRKHQIRAQLAHLGHPIIGDKIYSQQGQFYLKRLQAALSEQDYQQLGGPYQQLTAVSVQLNLPEGVVTICCE